MDILSKYNFLSSKEKYNYCQTCGLKKDYYSLLEPNCKVCYMHKYYENLLYIIGNNCSKYQEKFISYIKPLYEETLKKFKTIKDVSKIYDDFLYKLKNATNLFFENAKKEFFEILFETSKNIDIDYNNIKEKYLYLVNKLNSNLVISTHIYDLEYSKISENIKNEIEKILIDLHNQILYQTNEFEINLEKQYVTKMFFIFNQEFSDKII